LNTESEGAKKAKKNTKDEKLSKKNNEGALEDMIEHSKGKSAILFTTFV